MSKWWQNVIWPFLRVTFVIVHRLLGWIVVAAKAPLMAGHDSVGQLHDRYEDHRAEIRRDGLGVLTWSNWQLGTAKGVPPNQSIRDRRKGADESWVDAIGC